ncbi:MinD-like ATPase involved in chromosome partitioning or flagellar assembly [Arthrobacter pigmenti]|uniref:MinD-like ATPase involved in chromosome partitioning or flagellar assembly n=1 Tax=Arthrobacter pigmenti TaxID=271432 RepID=A0A846RN66_9MICC|nr:MinD/ParA family protein [Arthrobacter pigmenti]NJC22062.1 MinD-like ATPase involved in chromosome partitioning or flagellar assembly [Arthrobacter pigmenti]
MANEKKSATPSAEDQSQQGPDEAVAGGDQSVPEASESSRNADDFGDEAGAPEAEGAQEAAGAPNAEDAPEATDGEPADDAEPTLSSEGSEPYVGNASEAQANGHFVVQAPQPERLPHIGITAAADGQVPGQHPTEAADLTVADSDIRLSEDDEGSGWMPSPGRRPETGRSSAGMGGAPDRSARREKEEGPEPASSLTADRLLASQQRPPVGGWRLWLYKASFGYLNLGDSDAIRIRRALEHRISVRLGERTRYVPVLSRKGGVGKTTVTTLLGMALADIREDRIIAMDANPDRGTLSDRSPGRAEYTARQLVQNRFMVDSFAQLSSYVARDGSRLHVLASDTDPTVAQAFDDADYRAVTDILGRYYSIVLTDSGTGMVHSVMKGTLEKADAVVLVSGGSVDEARLASETLSWLEAHGRHDLVAKAIVVINMSSGSRTEVNVNEIEEHFRSRVGTVIRIPYDRHLAEGSRVDLAKLQPRTRDAVTELAALVVDQLH